MNKKASLTTFQLFMALIAVAILAIVIIYFWQGGGGLLEKFKILVTPPNQTQPPTKDSEVFRYNIQTLEVEYYDGVNAIPFKDKEAYEVNDKKVPYQKTKDTFYNFYRGLYEYKGIRKGNERISLPINFVDKIYEPSTDLYKLMPAAFDTCTNKIDSQGNTIIILIRQKAKSCQSKSYGEFQIDANNNIGIKKVESFDAQGFPILEKDYSAIENAEVKTTILNIATKWRDSILKNPITITYTNTETNSEESITVCAEKRDNYLIVDLSEPKTQC